MTPPTPEARLQAVLEIIERMRAKSARWQHSYGSCEVVYANVIDDWWRNPNRPRWNRRGAFDCKDKPSAEPEKEKP